MNIRRLRNFLELTQTEVSAATGVSVTRLSAAENGRTCLNRTEERALSEFYKARLRMVADEAKEDSALLE